MVTSSSTNEETGANPSTTKRTLGFVISARKLKIGNAEHTNDWPKA